MTDKERKALAELIAVAECAEEYCDDKTKAAWEQRHRAAYANARAVLATAPAEPPKEEIAMSSGTLREAARWLDTGKGRRPDGCTLRCIADVIDRFEPHPSGEVAALIERLQLRTKLMVCKRNDDCWVCEDNKLYLEAADVLARQADLIQALTKAGERMQRERDARLSAPVPDKEK